MRWLEEMAHTLFKVVMLEACSHLVQLSVYLLCVYFELCKRILFEVIYLLVGLALVDLTEAAEQRVMIHRPTVIVGGHRVRIPKLALIIRDVTLNVKLVIELVALVVPVELARLSHMLGQWLCWD